MTQQKKKKKTSKKTKVVGVRFDIEVLELVKKDRNLTTPHEVLAFYEEWYKHTYHSMATNPVMDRNEPVRVNLSVIEDEKEIAELVKQVAVPQKNVPRGTSPVEHSSGQLTPPPGLTGIDLSIWKRENGIK